MVRGDWIVLAFLGITVVREGIALRCYSCSSREDANCIDPPKHRMVSVFCNDTALTQVKILASKGVSKDLAEVYELDIKGGPLFPEAPFDCVKQITKENENSEEVILRGCQIAVVEKPKFCEKIVKVGGNTITHCSTCNTDDCNAASYETSSVWMTLLLATLLTFSNKHLLTIK